LAAVGATGRATATPHRRGDEVILAEVVECQPALEESEIVFIE
jgi:hypothetical protein